MSTESQCYKEGQCIDFNLIDKSMMAAERHPTLIIKAVTINSFGNKVMSQEDFEFSKDAFVHIQAFCYVL